MKIILTFVALVCLSFLVGYGYVSTTQTLAAPVAAAIALPEKTPPLVKMPPQLETIEEVENGIKEEYLFKIKLLETGEGFHGDEVDAESGAVWLGLFKENNEHFLRSEKIKIRRVHDEIVDEDEQSKSGKSVSVAGKNQPLFLLRNADSLKSGAIKTLFQGYTSDDMDKAAELGVNTDEMQATLEKGFVQKYEIGGKEYTLKVKDAINKRQEKILALVLESKGAKQILHTINEKYTNYLGTLYWVGDLDHDQKPDFYIELYIHDNVSFKNLYLSSEANGSDLIKKVAYFSTTGC